MLTLLLLAAFQSASQDAPPSTVFIRPQVEGSAEQADELTCGQLREVQLLEPRQGVVRFATQVERGTHFDEIRPRGRDTSIAIFEGFALQPDMEMSVGVSLISGSTWSAPRFWHLIEFEDSMRLIVVEPERLWDGVVQGGAHLRVLSYPDGEELLSLNDVQTIEDVCVRDGEAEVLVRQGMTIRWLRISTERVVANTSLLRFGLVKLRSATFVRGEESKRLRAWCLGTNGEQMVAVPFDEDGVDIGRATDCTFEHGPKVDPVRRWDSIHSAAWVHDGADLLAVAWPGYRHGVGQIQVLQCGAKVRTLWQGLPYPEVIDGFLNTMWYGHEMEFVPDANGDGAPDLIATGPWNYETTVDVLSSKSGDLIRSWKRSWFSTGHSLSLSADMKQALVGGTVYQRSPEDLSEPGEAFLLDVARMEPIRSWIMASKMD